MLQTVTATRYVVPLREGGSLPAIVEADDDGMYVVKFTGAGQGPRVLAAEIIAAGIARSLGLLVPDVRLVDLPPAVARYEADEEAQDLLNASPGINLGSDYLPGAAAFEASTPIGADEASTIMWLDGLVMNIDRSWRNPNLLVWHGRVWCIDHGAALYFHHGWERAVNASVFAASPYQYDDHVLAERGAVTGDVHERCAALVTDDVLADAIAHVPDEWLLPNAESSAPESIRRAYVDYLSARRDGAVWVDVAGGAS